MREVERINKSVITADSIEVTKGWGLGDKENPFLCYYCLSPLFYIRIVWGIVEDEVFEIKVVGKEREPQYSLREVGFILYCAECGCFHEKYDKYFYPKDKLVCCWDDDKLDLAEIESAKILEIPPEELVKICEDVTRLMQESAHTF